MNLYLVWRRILILLILSPCALVTTAQAKELTCHEILRSRWLRRGLDPKRQEVSSTHYSVSVGLPLRTDSPDIMLRFTRKPDQQWYSTMGPFNNAPQGDPRWIFMQVGFEVAEILGFQMPGENVILIPTVARLNRGIARLNSVLPENERIGVYFYEQGPLLSDTTYLNRLNSHFENIAGIEKNAIGIPINLEDMMLTIHDVAFHLPIVGAPVDFAKRVKVLARFFDSVVNLKSDKQKRTELLDSANRFIDFVLAASSTATLKREEIQDYFNDYVVEALAGKGRRLENFYEENNGSTSNTKTNNLLNIAQFELSQLPGAWNNYEQFYHATMLRRAQLIRAAKQLRTQN